MDNTFHISIELPTSQRVANIYYQVDKPPNYIMSDELKQFVDELNKEATADPNVRGQFVIEGKEPEYRFDI